MLQRWTDNAAGWRTVRAEHSITSRAATEAIVEAAGVRPGMQVLDLASGTGQPCLALAERVGRDGQVTATDLVPSMLAGAMEAAQAQALTNITFQQADAEALPFADQSFDAVTCRFGAMFFSNLGQALAEIHRVLKPGGRVALVVWGPLEQNPQMAIAHELLDKYGQQLSGTAFRLSQPATLEDALRTAGFQQVQVEPRRVPWPVPGPPEEFWADRQERSAELRRCIASLTPEQRDQLRAEVLQALAPYHDGQQATFIATIIVATAVR
jgi:ubiquinone/menaquinone biosynthesis C-methylase UbiE